MDRVIISEYVDGPYPILIRHSMYNVSPVKNRRETVSCCARKACGASECERSLDKRFHLALKSTRAQFYIYLENRNSCLRMQNVSLVNSVFFPLSGRAFGLIVDDRRRVVLASESQNKLSKG